MNQSKIFIFSLGLIIICASFLSAGIYLEGSDTHKGNNVTNSTKIYVEKDRLRVEAMGDDGNMVIIFREDKDLFWMLDMGKKEYREMTKDDIKKMKAKMDEAMKQMEEQLKNLPPEQRKMMEEMMPSHMNFKKDERPVFTKKGSNIKVNKWNCSHYLGEVNGTKKEEVWTTGWDQLGIKSDELGVFRVMGEFFSSLAPDMTDMFQIGDEEYEKNGGFAGMPVKSIDYEDGKISSQFEMKEITKKDLNSSLFDVPSGFDKVSNEWQEM